MLNLMIIKMPLSMLVHRMSKLDKDFLNSHKTFGTYSVKKDLAYIDDGDRQHLFDIIAPVLNHDNGITLFYIHGGAYIYGDKDLSRVFTSWFANQGFTIISINYRLVNNEENIDIRNQISDVFAALSYVYENRHFYDLKLDKFCLMGDSAGGHLSLLTDIIYHSKEAQKYYGINSLPNISIKCLALNSTMYDYPSLLPFGRKYLTKRNLQKIFSKNCFDPDFMMKNSPSYYLNQGVQIDPIFNSTAYHDLFLSQSLRLRREAKELKIPLNFLLEASSRKDVGHVYNHFIFDDVGLKCNQAMVDFFKKNCSIE